MPNIEEQTRRDIAAFLPGALSRALASYFQFSKESPEEEESKKFAAQHNAAKAAISHVELIVKLAKWADLPDQGVEDEKQRNELALMLANAHGELHSKKR